ncbi:CvpA family protein [Hyphomonas sp. WL0036]|uniref:CvpA family protein n=1 Tax=Hyphomonas sediminis TaxID=2866160 RepID=UPI001C7F1390|nr:CvpA family protein [Hyphomonas sediminis]MBY9065315.1 CvpA family protein [Hyphomonas sediminis]
MLENISAFDGIVVGVIVVSAIMAFARGFLRELATLGAFIGALAAAYYARKFLSGTVAQMLPDGTHPLAPDVILVVTAFLIVYVIVAWFGQSLSKSIMTNGEIGLFDHIAGLVFGIFRGFIALVFFAVLLNVAVEHDRVPPFIAESFTYPYLEQIADGVTGEAEEASRELSAVREDQR